MSSGSVTHSDSNFSKWSFGRVSYHCPETCGVSNCIKRGGYIDRLLKENEDFSHLQASSVEVAKIKATYRLVSIKGDAQGQKLLLLGETNGEVPLILREDCS